MRQLKEARLELMNMEEDVEDHAEAEETCTTAWDDAKGKELDPRRVVQARAEEI